MSTIDDLKSALGGESKAYMKYIAAGRAAEKEGRLQAARLFRALAEAEIVHAQNHLMVMGEIKATNENLDNAIDGETYEFTQMYPSFIAQAEREGNQRALISFRGAMAAEKVHSELLVALQKLDGKETDSKYFVCPVCGNITIGSAPEKCPTCNASGSRFKAIE
jgi:rubrerythrin